MLLSKKHTPAQSALLEAAELRGLLEKTRGPDIQQSKEAYLAAWMALQANPHERKLAIAAAAALRQLGGRLEARMIMGTRAKRLLYRYWEEEALKAAAVDPTIFEAADRPQTRGESWVRELSDTRAQLRLQQAMSGWGK